MKTISEQDVILANQGIVPKNNNLRLMSALLLLVFLLPSAKAGLIFATTNGLVRVVGYSGGGEEVVIPSVVDGLPVVQIGREAFSGAIVTKISIPEGIQEIGDRAFESSSIREIRVPNTVTNIGHFAFNYCQHLTNAVIGTGVLTIGIGAFSSCSVTSVTLSEGLKSIGPSAFAFCSALSAISVPASVVDIGENAFQRGGLKEISVIGGSSKFISVEGVLFERKPKTLLVYPTQKTSGSYDVPDTVEEIGDYAFFECSTLTNLSIPRSVVRVGDWAFTGCSALKEASIAEGVTRIGAVAFSGCYNLTRLTIPGSVLEIGSGAFSHNYSLENVVVRAGVTNLGSEIFANCSNLKGVYFVGDRPNVGTGLFNAAENAVVYYLPNSRGWDGVFAGRPAVLWNPTIDSSSVLRSEGGQFEFTITGSDGIRLVVESSSDLSKLIWSPVGTNTLVGGSSRFADPDWMNHSTRVYRLRSPY